MNETTVGEERLATKQVVVIGGGTGTFTVLSGLKQYPLSLTAIVTMADDGGSTGKLRDELGVLPPGDLRQCLVALSDEGEVMRRLFNHRFEKGDLAGHSFGNLFISALEQVTGDLDHALDLIGNILHVRGRVVPVTLDKVGLMAELKNGKKLVGESALTDYQLVSRYGIKKITLSPKPKVNPKALTAIAEADLIVLGPGNLYSSLVPNLLVPGVATAIAKSRARKVYVANLMNKSGQTDDFAVMDYVRVLEEIGKRKLFDTVVYNTKRPAASLLRKYADEGEPVSISAESGAAEVALVGVNLLAEELHRGAKTDLIRRTLIRHDPERLAKTLVRLLDTPLA